MEQYDEKLGGKTPLPFLFNVEDYVAGHIEELNALTNAIENPSKTKLAFQRLPKHMRRRVMSHNVKRMPQRMREAHAKYLEKQNLKVSKRPTRKYRRRHSNLLAEYNRRQRRHVWLETHIWHAKRFAMRALWGYKLAERPNEKSYRACERALERHCLLQDISYLVCIELSGPESSIVQGLNHHFSRTTGFSPGAKFHLSGCKEGQSMFYERDRFPFGALGRVRFLWRPKEKEEDDTRQLWIWAHPSFYESVMRELIATFSLELESPGLNVEATDECYTKETAEPMDDSTPCPLNKKSPKERSKNNATVEPTKLDLKNLAPEQVPSYAHASSGVRLRLLKDSLNRFELRGPLSGAILARALLLYERTECDDTSSIPFTLTPSLLAGQKELSSLWRLLQSCSPAQFPPRSVLGAIVRDPRFNMPAQRSRNELDACADEDIVSLASFSPQLARSPLWESAVRYWCSTSKLSTHQVNQIRSERLVPGVPCPRELKHVSPLPVILIQQEAVRNRGYGSGWDLVFPAGWSMPLLLALVMRGARVGGLREALHMSTRMRTEPALPVDTQAWIQYEARETEQALEKYFRKPPKNRPNFIRLGVPSPFSFPWTVLLNDWKTNLTSSEMDREKSESNVQEAVDRKYGGFSTLAYVHQSMDEEESRECNETDRKTSREIESIVSMDVDETTPFVEEQKQTNKDECQKKQMKQSHQPGQPTGKMHEEREQHQQQENTKNIHLQETQHQEEQDSNKSRRQQNTPKQQQSPTIPTQKDYYVLRDKQLIETLNDHIGNLHRQSPTEWNQLESLFRSIPHGNECLLQVNLEMVKRGTMDKYSLICLPSQEEFGQMSSETKGFQRKFRGVKGRGGSVIETRRLETQDSQHEKTDVGLKKRGKHGRRKFAVENQRTQTDKQHQTTQVNVNQSLGTKLENKQINQHKPTKENVDRNLPEKSHSKDHQKKANLQLQQELKHHQMRKDFYTNQCDPIGQPIREPPHSDPNSLVRKHIRSQHKALLARMRRRRVRAKKRGPNAFESSRRVKRKVSPSQDVVETYRSIMQRLWVPEVALEGDSAHLCCENKKRAMQEDTTVGERTSSKLGDSAFERKSAHLSYENQDEAMEEVSTVDEGTLSKHCDKTKNIDSMEEGRTTMGEETSTKLNKLLAEENSASRKVHEGNLANYLNSLKRVFKDETNRAGKQDKRKTQNSRATTKETDITNTGNDGKIEDNIKSTNLTDLEPNSNKHKANVDSKHKERSRKSSDDIFKHKKRIKDHLKIDDIMEDEEETQGNTTKSKIKNSNTSQTKFTSPSDVITRLQPIRSLRYHASHQLFGFVTSRRYHATAHCAQGCVTLNGFVDLLERMRRARMNRALVLVRQTKHVDYHWASLSLV